MKLDCSKAAGEGFLEDRRDAIERELELVKSQVNEGYGDWRGTVNLPSDDAMLERVREAEDRLVEPDLVVVCGIGGSNLGTAAVHEAVPERAGAELAFLDTVDPDHTRRVLDRMEEALDDGNEVVVNAVSKSGRTAETLANFKTALHTLESHGSADGSVAVTTSDGSPLWEFADKRGFEKLAIPEKVGGRYSVLSQVGLLPLSLAGVDVEALRQGARKARDRSLEPDGPAGRAAAALHDNYERGRSIHDMFVFSKELESLGKWFRQLTAESLGKNGEDGAEGITPLVSVGSVDLHSMQQLYMGGPNNKIHSLISVGSEHSVRIQSVDGLSEGPAEMGQGELMDAIEEGVEETFSEADIPFMEVELENRSEAEVGAFLQHKMIETMVLGRLLGVNAFDQPDVEGYKQATRDILREDGK